MIRIDGFKVQRHREFELDAIAILPGALDGSVCARLGWARNSRAVDREHGVWRGPAGNADIQCVVLGLRSRHLDLDFVVERILGFLGQSVTRLAILPLHAGRGEKIHIHTICRAQIGADVVVRRELREGSRTTWPLLSIPDFLAGGGVVRVIKRGAVGLNRPCAENRVVKHSLHAVTVLCVLGYTKQVAGDFKVGKGAAWRCKAGVSESHTVSQLSRPGFSESFIGTPATGSE